MWNQIIVLFRNYIGNGYAAGLFAVSFFYLLFTEKDKVKRLILLYLSSVVIALYFCPLFAAGIFRYLDGETYYRFLWMVPMTAVIAYAGVRLITDCSKKRLRVTAGVFVCAAIMLTGDYVYDNPFFRPAENRFHVPHAVAEVCDAIIVEGREVRAAFPEEMIPFVRQYTSLICMPYGREVVVERWGTTNELYDALRADVLDCEKITASAAEQECHYIIVNATKPGQEDFEKNGYHFVETIAGYSIYLQDDVYLGVDFSEEALKAWRAEEEKRKAAAEGEAAADD